jgi:hypothetical protein
MKEIDDLAKHSPHFPFFNYEHGLTYITLFNDERTILISKMISFYLFYHISYLENHLSSIYFFSIYIEFGFIFYQFYQEFN